MALVEIVLFLLIALIAGQESSDLSSEAAGLLLTFHGQDRISIVLLFAIKYVLDPFCKLALKLQHQTAV